MASTQPIESEFVRQMYTHHRVQLKASAISDDVIAERGYFSVSHKKELVPLGFKASRVPLPAMVIPTHTINGGVIYQLRPDQPRFDNGKARKYELQPGLQMHLDVPKRVLPKLQDPRVPLFITEGSKKVDAAISQELCCIGLLGVNCWRGRNEHGGITTLSDWNEIALNGRRVYIVFDSDVMTKPGVYRALERLKKFLESRLAEVQIIYLPGDDGKKVGLDDFFAAGHTPTELMMYASKELRGPAPQTPDYAITDKGIFLVRGQSGSQIKEQLTNYRARIVRDRIEDDGVEQAHFCEIVAAVGSRPEKRFMVPSAQFNSLRWVAEKLGPLAVTYPNKTEQARTAIQLISDSADDYEEKIVFKHTGWRFINGRWVYLHGGGAIGAEGPIEGIEVALPDDLAGMQLPALASGETLIELIKEYLDALGVGPLRITLPVFLSVVRAILGQSDFGVFLYGQTGTRKTTLASIAQRFFGAELCKDRPILDYTSTANAIEVHQFTAKDMILFIDDFAPSKDPATMYRREALADRVFRGNAGGSGRGRLNSDSTLKAKKYARCLTLSTGEEMPGVRSVRARALAIDMKDGDLDLKRLRLIDDASRRGDFAALTATFICWLAAQYDEVSRRLKREIADVRDTLEISVGHPRIVENVAGLIVTARYLLTFFEGVGAISGEEAQALEKTWTAALREVGEGQELFQVSEDPVERFFEVLRASILGGMARIDQKNGGVPHKDVLELCGWHQELEMPIATGKERIGWLEYDPATGVQELYLHPELTLKVIHQFCAAMKTPFDLKKISLEKYLNDRNKFKTTEMDSRKTYTVRKTCERVPQRVWHFSVDVLRRDNGEVKSVWDHLYPE